MSAPNIEHIALTKFGISVPPQHRDEVLKLIKSSPAFKEEFENIKNSLNTMLNEDDFLETVTTCHANIMECSENAKVIIKRDSTFQIRAINPENIASLTERAFFNSFSLERIILNDQEEENTRKHAQDREEERQNEREKPEKEAKKEQNEDEDKCVCGKVIPDSLWILCCNENKCRGSDSGWYHLECAGVKAKQEDIQHLQFVCQKCRRPQDEDNESESSQKRFKAN